MVSKTLIDPFRLKSVEAISFTTREHRERALANGGSARFALALRHLHGPPRSPA